MKKEPVTGLSRSHLASLIESDIRKRGLRSGERYLTAQEVAQVLGVSPMTANRAMQELARREILIRNRKSGTFVGARFQAERPVSLKCVHLLMPSEYFTTEKALIDLVVAGIHVEFPEDAIQFTFVPSVGDVAFVRSRVEEAKKTGTLGGFVLFLSSPAVQRFFQDSGVPTVIAGSVYAETGGLPWFDKDQKEIGRLLARAALKRGHRRIAVLMRDRWGAGDNLMIDGIHEELGVAKVGFDGLNVRSFPVDPIFIGDALRGMLQSPTRPTALICRSRVAANAATRAAEDLGLAVPKDVAIFLADYYANDTRSVPYPHTVTFISPEEHGISLARLLKNSARGQKPDSRHHPAPVVFRDPARE